MNRVHDQAVDVSCVFITWNSAKYIQDALTSVHESLRQGGLSHEIFVIDNGSSDETLHLIAKLLHLPITVIPLGRNSGTTFSRNIGLRMARGRYIAALDSDIKITDKAVFRRLVEVLDSDPNIGIVGPRLTYANGKHQKSSDVFPNFFTKVKRYLFLKSIEQKESDSNQSTASGLQDVDYLISAFWLFSTDLPARIGLLDEHIFYAPEDVDYCLRCWLGGRRVVIDQSTVAVHDAQEISRKKFFSRSMMSHIKGMMYFHYKYGNLFSNRRLYWRINRQLAATVRVINRAR